MGKMFKAKDAVCLTRPGAKATMYLPTECRFVIVTAGASPSILPLTEEGDWEVDIPPDVAVSVTEWPVLILVLPHKHADLYAKITPDMATDIIHQARRAYAQSAN